MPIYIKFIFKYNLLNLFLEFEKSLLKGTLFREIEKATFSVELFFRLLSFVSYLYLCASFIPCPEVDVLLE